MHPFFNFGKKDSHYICPIKKWIDFIIIEFGKEKNLKKDASTGVSAQTFLLVSQGKRENE